MDKNSSCQCSAHADAAPPHLVIPAQAGIQCRCQRTLAVSKRDTLSSFKPMSNIKVRRTWIPAFAGMTVGFAHQLIIFATLLLLSLSAQSAQTLNAQPIAPAQVSQQDLTQTVQAFARYLSRTALDEQGRARGDYDLRDGTWHPYESAWHTGQSIWGLLHAHRYTQDSEFIDAASRAGDWWRAQQISEGKLKGMLNAAHGDSLGTLINFTTLADGTPGLFELSRVTGRKEYADTATEAARWSMHNLLLPEQGLLLNIVDPVSGEIWRDRSPHHKAFPAALNQVARPNIEGFLFLDAYLHSKDANFLDAFNRTIERARKDQHANGFWMDYEPNATDGKIHPRFNLWYAEALLRAATHSRNSTVSTVAACAPDYVEAATRTVRAMLLLMNEQGAIFYDNRDIRYANSKAAQLAKRAPKLSDLAIERQSLTSSASAFLGIVLLDLKQQLPAQAWPAEFEQALHRIAYFLTQHRYPETHPDQQLRGALMELRQRSGNPVQLRMRPMATAFGLRYLVRYAEQQWPNNQAANADAELRTLRQQLPVSHLSARRKQSLDGQWRYIIDPYQIALTKPRPPRRSLHLDERADASENPLIEYEWDSARKIAVPSDWNTAAAELAWYEGMLWYQRRFNATELRAGEQQVLYFEGANYRTRVWLNGEPLTLADGHSYHDGGFNPFQFDVTGKLKPSGNSLVVAVDSTRRAEAIPSLDFDWFNYGGITRSVHLLHLPSTHIASAHIALVSDESANQANISVRLQGAQRALRQVRFSLAELAATFDIETDIEGFASVQVALPSLQSWSPEQPKRYQLQVQLLNANKAIEDSIAELVGLRRFEVRGNDLYLNDQPVFMRGISIHEERLGAEGGRVRNAGEARALLKHAKRLGANFVRLAHYPHSEAATQIADELGLMVWSEIPVYWDEIRYADPAVLQLARRMQASNIERDYNRASVVLWSVANETSITPARNAFLRRLISDAKALDGTRAITAALNKAKQEGDTIRVEDPLGADLDVISVNQYEGWYGERTPAQIPSLQFVSNFDKPFIFSEFGADAPRTFRADKAVRWSADYQNWLYEQNLALFDSMPELDGINPWILKDFQAPRRWHGRFQNYWNRKGLIDETGRDKISFATLQTWFKRMAAKNSRTTNAPASAP